jgi:hypothetical protein
MIHATARFETSLTHPDEAAMQQVLFVRRLPSSRAGGNRVAAYLHIKKQEIEEKTPRHRRRQIFKTRP